ncbi:MAG TPA: TonB-dependent receptor [Candidatus Cryptobacteroides excrementigallinarum]|nr:TonB-dependent receptor [Candidatus Cryptobacteroides excrementigallinarum]
MRKILTLALLFLSVSVFAQQHSVKGTVTDQNGLPVIGMAVMEQGTTNGVVTDENGEYSITVSGPDVTLEFYSLGYETVTEAVRGRAVIDVVSGEEATALEGAVAIGYGTVKKQDLTTAVSVVSNEDMKLRPVSEASGFIQGKVAGVQVQQTSGLPGGGMTVRIRGASSIASSNDPLYVVDGVPVGEGNYAIAYLSPNDIESMSILKDASSAAIYGSRAANGVVLITTKQGKVSRGPQINFSGYVGLSNVAKTYDVLNVEQYKDLMDEIGAVTLPDGLKDETDWFKETYQTGVSQNYQISVSNGNDKLRYYLGGGYTDEQGIIDVAYNRRYNFKASVDSDLFDWISVGTNMAYSSYKSNGIISGTGSNRAGVVLSVINTPTYAKVWDEENPDWYWTNFYGANLTTPAENMARTENNYNQTDRLLLTGYATIKFTKNLNFKSTVTMDRRWTHDYSFLDPIHTSYGRTQHGTASSTRADDMRMVYDNILTYNNTWNGVHNFEAMGGTSATTSRWENLSGSRSYFSTEYNNVIWGLNGGNKGGLRGQSQGYAEWAIMSYLARVSYNYDSKYYITANIRADGSSKLAPGNKWGYFPSVSAAWRISAEPWMEDISWISDLKLRAGWGQSGNQSGLADYAWVQEYSTNYYDWTDEEYAEAAPTLGGKSNIGNKDLTWETTTQTNVGVDFAILDNRVTFTLDGYYKYTKDMLMNVPLPSPNPSIYRNEGEMSNWGIEFAVSSVNIDRPDFTWNTDFNISMNRNRLEKLQLQQVYYYTKTSEALSEYVVRMTPGQPLSMFWGYNALGVDPETGMVIYEDINGDGKVNSSDKQYIGNANPLFTFGMTNTLSWKGFNLSFLITGSVGNDIYNASRIEMIGMYNGSNQITDVLRRWRVPGQVTDIPKAGELDNLRASTRWVEDGSYLKIKNITLSYDFSGPWLREKLNISRIQPYITLDNMITFTNYSGYDPEMSQYTSATSMGIDWGTYPNVKTVTFGVNVDF